MSDQPQPDDEAQSSLSPNWAARLRSTSLRAAIAALCAAAGAAAIYLAMLIPNGYSGTRLGDSLALFETSQALGPAGMILLLIALIAQPPGRARVYTRVAFVLTVLGVVLTHIFALGFSFPDAMGWWYDWYP